MTIRGLESRKGCAAGSGNDLMTRYERDSKRWLWSLAAGVLLVPVLAVGAIADTSPVSDHGNHAKQNRGIGHVRTTDDRVADDSSDLDRSMTKEEHEALRSLDCDPLIETDHPPFETAAAHKAFHGIPTEIDHTNDPVFATAAEHKAFHGIPCGISDPEQQVDHGVEGDADATTKDGHASSAEAGSGDDGSDDDTQLKEQPLDRPEDASPHENQANSHGDRSQRDQESSEDRTN